MKKIITLLLVIIPLISEAQDKKCDKWVMEANTRNCYYKLVVNDITLTSDCNLDSVMIKGDTMKLIRFLIKEQYQNLPHDHK